MDIHKPKPWHGVREFLKEYLIIVAGVLTALAGEQIVSSIEWHNRVVEAREDLADELAEDMGKMTGRTMYALCISHRLDDIAAMVDRAATTGKLPPLPIPRSPVYNSWAKGVWESVQSGQTASHMGREELRTYSRLYQMVNRVDENEAPELRAWTVLYGLAGPGRVFTPADAQVFREAIADARTANGLIAGFGVRMHQIADPHHIPYQTAAYWDRINRFRARKDCTGFETSPPPPAYGASPTSDFVDIAIKNPLKY